MFRPVAGLCEHRVLRTALYIMWRVCVSCALRCQHGSVCSSHESSGLNTPLINIGASRFSVDRPPRALSSRAAARCRAWSGCVELETTHQVQESHTTECAAQPRSGGGHLVTRHSCRLSAEVVSFRQEHALSMLLQRASTQHAVLGQNGTAPKCTAVQPDTIRYRISCFLLLLLMCSRWRRVFFRFPPPPTK